MKNRPTLHDIEAFNRKREQELDREPTVLEEDAAASEKQASNPQVSELLRIIETQKSEIKKIRSDLARVVEQLEDQKRLLEDQDKEIAQLKQGREDGFSIENVGQPSRLADDSYNKELILRNIVSLIEERGFSYNDVARLFRLEDFLPPSPYENWTDKVVEELYAVAGK